MSFQGQLMNEKKSNVLYVAKSPQKPEVEK